MDEKDEKAAEPGGLNAGTEGRPSVSSSLSSASASSSVSPRAAGQDIVLESKSRKIMGHGDPDIDHDEIEAVVPGHALDLELGEVCLPHPPLSLLITKTKDKTTAKPAPE